MYTLQPKTNSLNFICTNNKYVYIIYIKLCNVFWINKVDVFTIYIAGVTFVFP